MFLHIKAVQYLGDYRLRLTFSDGAVKDVDLSGELYGEVFEPLQRVDFFKNVALNPDSQTIEWPNGADFAPEYLHSLGKDVQKVA